MTIWIILAICDGATVPQRSKVEAESIEEAIAAFRKTRRGDWEILLARKATTRDLLPPGC